MRRLSLAALLALPLTVAFATPALAFGPERFTADTVEVRNLLGSVTITVKEGADGITARAEGRDKDLLSRLRITGNGKSVVIDMDLPKWDERAMELDDDRAPKVELTVPAGTDLSIDDMIGELKADGRLDKVLISLEAAASMELDTVGTLTVDAHGALNLQAGSIENGLTLSVHGAANINVGSVTGKTAMSIHGMSNVDIDRQDGALAVSLNGVGRIDVEGGRSDRVEIDVNGMGSVSYQGEVAEQRVSKSGLGSVSINGKSY